MDSPGIFPPRVEHFAVSTPTSRRNSSHIPRKSSWGTLIPPPGQKRRTLSKEGLFDTIDLSTGTSEEDEHWNTLDNITALGLSFHGDESPVSQKRIERFSMDDVNEALDESLRPDGDRPFNKWMKTLQKRGANRRQTMSSDMDRDALQLEFFESPGTRRRSSHKKSSSSSSFGFVTAVKSASISLASFSIAPRSRRTGVSSRHQRTDRSSKASNVGRLSEDSAYNPRNIAIDQAVTNRSIQRRLVLEEIISSEESYLGDVKFLMNVYVTLLASLPSFSLNLRASINRNLNDIVALHEDLLGDLHRIIPHSEYTQITSIGSPAPHRSGGHQRWRSLDAVPENAGSAAWLKKIPGMTTEPKIAAEVAKAFGKRMNRFFLYEEYGAKYELMIKDVASAYRTMPQWEVYQKGFEALASSLSSINTQLDGTKKALTVGDLLVKPIQRVCKYPLLFAELLKQTPVCDCPDSHIEIENVLVRLREATSEINKATDDPRMKIIMERTWLLQDRLVFDDMPDARSASSIRALGHVQLCGVLHVCWQTKGGVDGQYLICLLYRDFLLLASAPKADRAEQTYAVQACIGLSEVRVEEVDNGKGLQCHTASFTWKIVFECDHQLYEITMSACSPKEELEWRSRLEDRLYRDTLDAGEQSVFTSLSLRIKPLGTVFGKPGTIARRLSIHRATTVGPTTGLCQVIIKNTNSSKEAASSTSINRSQSLLTTNRIPVLAPPRAERIRLETLLGDVWTREILPFPGMSGRARSEHLVRASASSMMRKLSVASIASNFTKRSDSVASNHLVTEDETSGKVEAPKLIGSYEQPFIDTIIPSDTELDNKARVTSFQYDKENHLKSESTDSLSALGAGMTDSPGSVMRRFATLKGSKSWVRDRQRIITPPLRSSSANSVKQSRVTSLSTVADSSCEDKTSLSPLIHIPSPVTGDKRAKKTKGLGMNRIVVAEGIRNLFR